MSDRVKCNIIKHEWCVISLKVGENKGFCYTLYNYIYYIGVYGNWAGHQTSQLLAFIEEAIRLNSKKKYKIIDIG